MQATTTRFFPLVIGFTWGEMTLQDVAGIRADFERIHARGERFALISDSRGCQPPGARIRRELGELLRAFQGPAEENVIAQTTVLAGQLQVGVFTALKWIAGGMLRGTPVASAEKAFAQCCAAAEAEGIGLPSTAIEFVRSVDSAQSSEHQLAQLRRSHVVF